MPPWPDAIAVTLVFELPSKPAINQLVKHPSFLTRVHVSATDGNTLTPLDFAVPPERGSVSSVGIERDWVDEGRWDSTRRRVVF
jgi:hypothetical protein